MHFFVMQGAIAVLNAKHCFSKLGLTEKLT